MCGFSTVFLTKVVNFIVPSISLQLTSPHTSIWKSGSHKSRNALFVWVTIELLEPQILTIDVSYHTTLQIVCKQSAALTATGHDPKPKRFHYWVTQFAKLSASPRWFFCCLSLWLACDANCFYCFIMFMLRKTFSTLSDLQLFFALLPWAFESQDD